MSFVEKVEQLNQDIGTAFDRAFSALRRELQDRLRESHDDLDRRIEAFTPPPPARPFLAHEDLAPAAESLRAQARGDAFGELRDAFAALDRARTQADVLSALLAAAGRQASRAALLLVRGGELRGWGGQGFGDSGQALRELVMEPAAGSPWHRLADPAAHDGGAGAMQLSPADCAALCERIESPVPAGGWLVPLVLRDRVVAALYADQLPEAEAGEPAAAAAEIGGEPAGATGGGQEGPALPALQSLVYVAALAIESLPFRERPATATLATAAAEPATPGEAATAAPAAVVPAEAEPEPGAKPAPEPGAEAEAEAEAEPEPPPAATAATGEDTQPRAPYRGATPARLYDSPAVPVMKETAEIPLIRPLRPAEPRSQPAAFRPISPLPEIEAEPPSGAETSAAAAEPLAAEAEAEAETAETAEPAATATGAEPPLPDAAGERQTVLLPHAPPFAAKDTAPAFGEPWAPRYPGAATGPAAPGAGGAPNLRVVPDLAPPPPATAGSPPPPAAPSFEPLRTSPIGSTPEVRPPSGVQGPGWAFATTRVPAGDEALHEEARRLARLLVSEIKLYNEEQVEAGRRNRDIYERLREDIDRSRQMYEERVEPRIVKSTDYFYQELVRILAAGDSKALGI
jgi:hypothetical protein